jgi:DNA ligase-1
MATNRSTIIKCIEERIAEKSATMEQFMEYITEHSIENIPSSLGVGTDGTVVYPYPNCPVRKTKDSIYVPEMKDKFMLAENYIDKKTDKPVQITQRMSDYLYFSANGLKQPPVGWYMSEKFDGQRAIWDGEKFISRGSPQSEPRVYPYVPIWFVALMPPGIPLDGEFFIGRGKFTETTGILKTKLKEEDSRKKNDNTRMDLDKRWIDIKYQVFDTPSNEPFEDRQDLLKNIINERCKVWDLINLPPYLKKGKCPLVLTKQYLIKSEEQLSDYYEQLVSDEAEGVMVRAPKVEYLPKRTRLLLKLKPEEEGECILLGSGDKEGKGQFEGLLGSFHCELIEHGKRTGRTFYVGGMKRSIRVNYNNKRSSEYHPSGTILTFKYTEMTPDGIPRFPRYKGIREDFNLER